MKVAVWPNADWVWEEQLEEKLLHSSDDYELVDVADLRSREDLQFVLDDIEDSEMGAVLEPAAPGLREDCDVEGATHSWAQVVGCE